LQDAPALEAISSAPAGVEPAPEHDGRLGRSGVPSRQYAY